MKTLQNKYTNEVKEVGTGFNFWAFLLGFLILLYRGFIKKTFFIFILAVLLETVLPFWGFLSMNAIIGYKYNDWYTEKLKSKGWVVVNAANKL